MKKLLIILVTFIYCNGVNGQSIYNIEDSIDFGRNVSLYEVTTIIQETLLEQVSVSYVDNNSIVYVNDVLLFEDYYEEYDIYVSAYHVIHCIIRGDILYINMVFFDYHIKCEGINNDYIIDNWYDSYNRKLLDILYLDLYNNFYIELIKLRDN